MSGHHRHAWRCAALLLLASFVVPADSVRAEVGEVTGSVKVFEKRILRGLRESEQPSGVLVYLTGFKQSAPETAVQLHQRDRRFEPPLLPIVVGQTVEFQGLDLVLRGKRVVGSMMGHNRFRIDMPRFVDFYLDGRLKLDEMISARLELDQVNTAFDKMKAGEVARSVIAF